MGKAIRVWRSCTRGARGNCSCGPRRRRPSRRERTPRRAKRCRLCGCFAISCTCACSRASFAPARALRLAGKFAPHGTAEGEGLRVYARARIARHAPTCAATGRASRFCAVLFKLIVVCCGHADVCRSYTPNWFVSVAGPLLELPLAHVTLAALVGSLPYVCLTVRIGAPRALAARKQAPHAHGTLLHGPAWCRGGALGTDPYHNKGMRVCKSFESFYAWSRQSSADVGRFFSIPQISFRYSPNSGGFGGTWRWLAAGWLPKADRAMARGRVQLPTLTAVDRDRAILTGAHLEPLHPDMFRLDLNLNRRASQQTRHRSTAHAWRGSAHSLLASALAARARMRCGALRVGPRAEVESVRMRMRRATAHFGSPPGRCAVQQDLRGVGAGVGEVLGYHPLGLLGRGLPLTAWRRVHSAGLTRRGLHAGPNCCRPQSITNPMFCAQAILMGALVLRHWCPCPLCRNAYRSCATITTSPRVGPNLASSALDCASPLWTLSLAGPPS